MEQKVPCSLYINGIRSSLVQVCMYMLTLSFSPSDWSEI